MNHPNEIDMRTLTAINNKAAKNELWKWSENMLSQLLTPVVIKTFAVSGNRRINMAYDRKVSINDSIPWLKKIPFLH